MMLPELQDFESDWGDLDPTYLEREMVPAAKLPVDKVFTREWSEWLHKEAEAKSAPIDYVVAALFAVGASLIANVRWGSPWAGWKEPTVIWVMNIGAPSMGKSPAMDAVLGVVWTCSGFVPVF